MSADNWTSCPRCVRVKMVALDARQEEVSRAYGNVSIEEFDRMRSELARDRLASEKAERTFREDYTISGAEDGVVYVSYSGSCRTCGLSLNFDERHPIPGA